MLRNVSQVGRDVINDNDSNKFVFPQRVQMPVIDSSWGREDIYIDYMSQH